MTTAHASLLQHNSNFIILAVLLWTTASAFSPSNSFSSSKKCSALQMALAPGQTPVVIGVAADSGCGKSTFMRRLTSIFGGQKVGPLGGGFGNGGWETNTLVSDLTTVICLDDYHLNDRQGRKKTGLTALDVRENNFNLMFEQVQALKHGKSVSKPIYNHVNGTLDAPETIEPTPIIIIEGLHPMLDERVRGLLDFSLYLDISDEVKLNWKVQRDMEERGHSLESILASIEARKPDFAAYVAPQKQHADMIITVLPTKLDPNDKKTLRVQCIQRRRNRNFSPFYLFDEGSQIEWTPSYFLSRQDPGLKFISGPTLYSDESTVSQKGGEIVDLLEMDGSFSNIQELVYIEYHLRNIRCQFYGELAMSMMKLTDAPGSFDGTGLMQTLAAFAIRSIYERNLAKMVNLIKQ